MSHNNSKHQLTQNVKLLQKAVLIHDGKFLILQRNKQARSRPNCWDLPGGNSEWPETLVNQAGVVQNQENLHQKDIAREILEETGIIVFEQHFTLENMVLFKTFFETQNDLYSIITGWRVELPDDFQRSLVQLSDEHINHKWVTFDELNEYDFGNKKGEFIKDIIRAAL